MDKNNIILNSNTDLAFVRQLGSFVRHHRLNQNLTQSDLARNSGMNRSTLIEFEQGKNITLLSLVQLLRALNLLDTLNVFQVSEEISPMLLAEMQAKYRKRASRVRSAKPKRKSNW